MNNLQNPTTMFAGSPFAEPHFTQEFYKPGIQVGTIGHVAHGKSTLVKALTGIKPTRHSAEKIRGITIHLGYSSCKCYSNAEKTRFAALGSDGPPSFEKDGITFYFRRHVSFVDCPGHDQFMAVMMSGAFVMDAVILVVAANEPCPMPQTEEHLMVAEMVGLKNMLVVHNKVDLLSRDDCLSHFHTLRRFLDGTLGEDSPIFPTSACSSSNLEPLIEAIIDLPSPSIDLSDDPRMPIVRSFDVNGPSTPMGSLKGAVLGGTLVSGSLRLGDTIHILPSGLSTRVVSLRAEKESLEEITPGGLICVGTTLDPSISGKNRMVGQWIVKDPESLCVVKEALVKMVFLKRTVDKVKTKVKSGEHLVCHLGSLTLNATFERSKSKSVYRVTFDRPVVFDPSMRLIPTRRGRVLGFGKKIEE